MNQLLKNDHENLPTKAITKDGFTFNPYDQTWSFLSATRRHYFDFIKINKMTPDSILLSIKLTMIYYLENYSLCHVFNIFNMLMKFITYTTKTYANLTITPESLLTYKSTLGKRREWHLGTLRGFFKTWYKLGYSGIDKHVFDFLDELKLNGNPKGEAVSTEDPTKGPFSQIEFSAITNELNDIYAVGDIEIDDFVMTWLYLAFGSRSVQLAKLKVKDLKVVQLSDGSKSYVLQIPRAKQEGLSQRGEFKNRKLILEIGELLESYINIVQSKWTSLNMDPLELPLFPCPSNDDACRELMFHSTSEQLGKQLGKVFSKLNVISERTSLPIVASARRFRYTRATRAAAEGASALVIADLLDHIDTQNVGVYSRLAPDMIQRIDRAMALQLAPIAQAFSGVLISKRDELQTQGASDIYSEYNFNEPVGKCGRFGFCSALAPIGCYTCRNFSPWIDGPHQEILDQLIADRDRILTQTGDSTMASVNDRTILACAEVIRLCNITTITTD